MPYYVMHVVGDVEPELAGPFDTEDERDEHARQLKATDPDERNGIYWLDLDDSRTCAECGAYAGGFLDGGRRVGPFVIEPTELDDDR